MTVSGKITFDRVPFKATVDTGLDPNAPVESPAREIVVEAVGASGILATASTDANGDYSLSVPASTTMHIRAKAQMTKTGTAPTWSFSVRNNTNSDALYALDGADFNSGTANSTRNLRATTTYPTPRNSAPFAILDAVYQAKAMIIAAQPTAAFPALDLFWSINNRPSAGAFCPDNGDIGTSFYTEGGNDQCTPSNALPAGIYILGDFANGNGDTDEFDRHVLTHEFGHYIEDQFSRSDSLGGSHQPGDRLDLRLAFGEGWGNAFAAMSQNDPVYRDSQSGVDSDFSFNLEVDDPAAEGWFSEFSVMEILWDVFDSAADPGDTVALGFAPIFTVMTTDQIDTDAVTSIFSFADALRARNGASSQGINTLLNGESISVSDEFASNENNAGGSATALPVYTPVAPGTPVGPLCVSAQFGDGNKLGFTRFFVLDLSAGARTVNITATGVANGGTTQAAVDPDIYVYRRGTEVASGIATGVSETISQQPLPAGVYIIEVYDFELSGPPALQRCFTLSIQG